MLLIDKFVNIIKSKKHSLVNLFIHLSAISLFIIPEVITNLDHGTTMPLGVIIKTIMYLSIFYINYFLINRFLDSKGGKWRFLGLNILLLFIASCVILQTSHGYTDNKFHPFPPPPHVENINNLDNGASIERPLQIHEENRNIYLHAISRLSRDLFIAILSIALAFAIKIATRWLESQQKQASLIASQRETELVNLKSQINPHFLFNTLNSIYALIDINPSKAQSAIHQLSGMLRYAIYETSETVTIKQELNFISSYISLMKTRMNSNRPIETNISCHNYCDSKIAPLLLIPIVENAFKYGNTANFSNPIKINISINDNQLKCYTFNHFDSNNNRKNSGMGLNNLQRRLNLIYKDNASLKITSQESTFQVELTINLLNNNNS